jgi:Flagellar hook-length control protein FliK
MTIGANLGAMFTRLALETPFLELAKTTEQTSSLDGGAQNEGSFAASLKEQHDKTECESEREGGVTPSPEPRSTPVHLDDSVHLSMDAVRGSQAPHSLMLVDLVCKHFEQSPKHLEIQIEDTRLGTISVRAYMKDGKVELALTVGSDEVREALSSELSHIGARLESMGFSLSRTAFTVSAVRLPVANVSAGAADSSSLQSALTPAMSAPSPTAAQHPRLPSQVPGITVTSNVVPSQQTLASKVQMVPVQAKRPAAKNGERSQRERKDGKR